MAKRTEFRGLAAVVGHACCHGATVPMQGISASGQPWHGLFCPANLCLPSWRNPADPWLVSKDEPYLSEQRERMAGVARTGVLTQMATRHERREGTYA